MEEEEEEEELREMKFKLTSLRAMQTVRAMDIAEGPLEELWRRE
jgi:ribosomal protein L29